MAAPPNYLVVDGHYLVGVDGLEPGQKYSHWNRSFYGGHWVIKGKPIGIFTRSEIEPLSTKVYFKKFRSNQTETEYMHFAGDFYEPIADGGKRYVSKSRKQKKSKKLTHRGRK